MVKTPKERTWIDDIIIQRNTLFSNVILIETDDYKRIEEIINYASKPECEVMTGDKGDDPERWLFLDGWDGFYEYKEKNKEIIKEQIEKGDVQQYGIKMVLPSVSKKLNEGRTVVVVTNIFKSDDLFNSALRNWSNSDKLREDDSTVLLFVDDRNIFPPEVWTHMKIIKPEKSTWDERKKMLLFQQKELKPKETLTDQEIEESVRLTAGMNLDQLESATIESIILKNKISLTSLARSKSDIIAKDPVVEVIQRPSFGFEAVGGYDNLKECIRDNVILPLKNPEMADRFCMKPPRGILLYGPPGSGKTLLINSMAKELNMSVVKLRMENVYGKYVGETEKAIRKAFDIVDAMAPCILFVDEIDRLSKRGDDSTSSSHVERELFSMLLEKLGDENRKWFFAAATNMIELIDPAMRRTGRIDTVVPVPYPDRKAREEIFKIHINIKRKLPLSNDINIPELAEKTYMWAGSDIEELVIRTARYVLKKNLKEPKKNLLITQQDFIDVYDSFNIDVKKNSDVQDKVKANMQEFTNDKRLMNVFDQSEKTCTPTTTKTDKAKNMMKGIDENK